MDYYSSTINSKMSKLEKSQLELTTEIFAAVKSLISLKDDADNIVRNLSSITTPATFLQEYMNVSSFILKYITFLSEINCKFEIMNISENNFRNTIPRSKAITSAAVAEDLVSFVSNCTCIVDLLSKDVKEKVVDNQPSITNEQLKHKLVMALQPSKKVKKKKAKKAANILPENKNQCVLQSTTKTITNSSGSEAINKSSCKNDSTSHTTKPEQTKNLTLKAESVDSEKNKENIKKAEQSKNLAIKAESVDSVKDKENINKISCKNDNTSHTTKAEQTKNLTIKTESTDSAKNKENIIKISCKNDSTSHTTKAEQTKNLTLKAESTDSAKNKEKSGPKTSDSVDHSHVIKSSEALNGKKGLSEKSSINENIKQKSSAGVSCVKSVNVTKNPPAGKIACNGDIPMTENISGKIQSGNSEVAKDSCTVKKSEEFLKITEISKAKEDEEECIKPEELVRSLGKEYNVTIEHIKSPSEFYVSIADKPSNSLSELERMLKLIPGNKPKVSSTKVENKKVLCSKEIGSYALFYSKCDEMWCRVKIVNWCLNIPDDFVSAFLLDYGETKCVSIADLRPMPVQFKKFPASIHRCHLHGIIPIDMDEDSKTIQWEKATSEKMKSLTETSKVMKIKIEPEDCFHPSTSLPVTLWLVDEDNQCVNDLLVKSKHAIWSSEKDNQVEENEKLKSWDPMKEDFDSYLNSYDLDMNDPAASIYGYVGKDYERICRHFARTGFCFKGQTCRKEHKKLDPLGLTTDQEEVYKSAFNTLPTPQPRSILNVQVTCLLKFNQFFCVSENRSLPSDEENLYSLQTCLNKVENVLEMKKLLIPPSPGQVVIARFSEDNCWYRARILESQPEKDVYTVVFVDYGNKESMPLSEIRAIEPRYLHLPFQAMQCFIFGVNENPKAPLKDVMDYMECKISYGLLSIEVISTLPGDYMTLLVNVFDQNGRNIGEDLIEKQYAVIKEELVISNDCESVPG